MNRCLWSYALLLVSVFLLGCAEESFDQPIVLPESVSPEALFPEVETGPPNTVHDWIGQPLPDSESEGEQPQPPSAVNSVWNALLEGTSQAMAETTAAP